MGFRFAKWNGLGNDFVIVDGFAETIDNYAETAIAVCDRHFGVGADGLVIIMRSEIADFRMRIFNSDGSEAEMCGNVTRCVARMLYEKKRLDGTKFTLETGAGIIRPEIILKDGKYAGVRVDMGRPVLSGCKVPVDGFGEEKVINEPITVDGKTFNMTCVSMGNPHCVIFVDDINQVELEKVGPLLETHSMFPKKINVEFVEVKDSEHLRMRVWERGAGITLACGTGSCATIVAAVLNNKTSEKADIELDGGVLNVEWSKDNHVYMTGPAEEVFRGEYIK